MPLTEKEQEAYDKMRAAGCEWPLEHSEYLLRHDPPFEVICEHCNRCSLCA